MYTLVQINEMLSSLESKLSKFQDQAHLRPSTVDYMDHMGLDFCTVPASAIHDFFEAECILDWCEWLNDINYGKRQLLIESINALKAQKAIILGLMVV